MGLSEHFEYNSWFHNPHSQLEHKYSDKRGDAFYCVILYLSYVTVKYLGSVLFKEKNAA